MRSKPNTWPRAVYNSSGTELPACTGPQTQGHVNQVILRAIAGDPACGDFKCIF